MGIKRSTFLSFCLCLSYLLATPSAEAQSNAFKKKQGWTFGFIPVIGYNTDIGFRYGGLVSVYNYGRESTYPVYRQMFHVDISRSTGGMGINQLFFDSDRLFGNSGIRLTADLSYFTDKVCGFYGFNGREVNYNSDFTDDDSQDYKTRVYYGMNRKLLRVTADLKGRIDESRFYWVAGIGYYGYNISTVDTARLNRNKSADKKLPDTSILYDQYVDWGLIPAQDADGGQHKVIKAGIVYDTRDIEANPSKGLWSEAILILAPHFLWNNESSFTRIAVTHRQYFTIFPDRLTFVYRLCYQGTITGTVPFYSMPYLYSSFLSSTIEEGLGGAKSIRGILRNRLIGEGVVYGNFEFRWKFLKAVLWKQNIYLALNPFLDCGRVVQKVPVDISKVPGDITLSDYFSEEEENFHFSSGCGLHCALNENFIVAADFGYAFSEQDGGFGAYIGINWLF